jgi:hypothetical protein
MKKLWVTLLILLFAASASAIEPGLIQVCEEDGAPCGWFAKLKVTNGTLTDNADSTVSVTTQAADADLTSIAGGVTGIVKGLGNGSGFTAAAAGTDYVGGAASSTDNELVRYDSTSGKVIQTSSVILDDTYKLYRNSTTDAHTLCLQGYHGDSTAFVDALCIENETASLGKVKVTVGANATFETGTILVASDSIHAQTGTTADDDMYLAAYDVDGAAYRNLITLKASNTPQLLLKSTAVMNLGGVGGTNNEDLTLDFETTANTVAVASTTGVTAISLGSLNLATTGTITGAIKINSDADGMSQAEMTTAGMYGSLFVATGAGTWNLPAAMAGMSFCMLVPSIAAVVINPDDSDVLIYDGTADDAGHQISGGAAAGDFICFIAVDTTNWHSMGRRGTWTPGS